MSACISSDRCISDSSLDQSISAQPKAQAQPTTRPNQRRHRQRLAPFPTRFAFQTEKGNEEFGKSYRESTTVRTLQRERARQAGGREGGREAHHTRTASMLAPSNCLLLNKGVLLGSYRHPSALLKIAACATHSALSLMPSPSCPVPHALSLMPYLTPHVSHNHLHAPSRSHTLFLTDTLCNSVTLFPLCHALFSDAKTHQRSLNNNNNNTVPRLTIVASASETSA